MSTTLTPKELQELKARFNSVKIRTDNESNIIVHTLSSGRIVKGVVTEGNVLHVSSVQSYLCG